MLRTGHCDNSSLQSYHNMMDSNPEAQRYAVFGEDYNARFDMNVMDSVERVTRERETGQFFPSEADDKNNDQDQRVE